MVDSINPISPSSSNKPNQIPPFAIPLYEQNLGGLFSEFAKEILEQLCDDPTQFFHNSKNRNKMDHWLQFLERVINIAAPSSMKSDLNALIQAYHDIEKGENPQKMDKDLTTIVNCFNMLEDKSQHILLSTDQFAAIVCDILEEIHSLITSMHLDREDKEAFDSFFRSYDMLLSLGSFPVFTNSPYLPLIELEKIFESIVNDPLSFENQKANILSHIVRMESFYS